MSEEYKIKGFQDRMGGYQQRLTAETQSINGKAQSARFDIEDWDSIVSSIQSVNMQISALHEQLIYCHTSGEATPEEMNEVARRRQAIQSQISSLTFEKSNLEMRRESRRSDLRRWQRMFSNQEFFSGLRRLIEENDAMRAEMVQYEQILRKTDSIVSSTQSLGGAGGNRFMQHIAANITAQKHQISDVVTMQKDLLNDARSTVQCYQQTVSILPEISSRIGDYDPQIDYGSKTL